MKLNATSAGVNAMAIEDVQEGICMTEEEYLRMEAESEVKHEYFDGRAYAMAGAGYNHNCITANVLGEFRNHLKGTPCVTFSSDMKVRIGKDYTYPDVLVSCDKMASDDYFCISPVIIVEVLSKSTRKRDTTDKLIRYINIPSVEEYVLIEQDVVSIEVLRRNNDWRPEYFYLGDSVTFDLIQLTLTVEEIYDRVDNGDMNEFRQRKHSLPEQ
jgi:Uma2 family endonuclease